MTTKYPNHTDPHAAGIYRAIALRFYGRYIEARHSAEYRGGDLADDATLPSEGEGRSSVRRRSRGVRDRNSRLGGDLEHCQLQFIEIT